MGRPHRLHRDQSSDVAQRLESHGRRVARLCRARPRLFDDAKQRDVRAVLTITDAKGDRSKSPSQQDDPDLYVRMVDRKHDDVGIGGAKMHISSSVVATRSS
jgi:aromatic ring hydroxylase